VWSPDGRRIAFAREVQESGEEFSIKPRRIYSIATDRPLPVDLVASHGDWPAFWSLATGRLAYERFIIDWSLWTTTPGEGTSRLVFRSSDRLRPALSRDAKWLAFEWTRGDSKREVSTYRDASTYIYVSPFQSGGKPTELPAGDAHNPVWAGHELFFATNGRLVVTRISASALGAPTFTEPVLIYEPPPPERPCLFCYGPEYDVMPDGRSVLVMVPSSPRIEVVPDISSRRIQ